MSRKKQGIDLVISDYLKYIPQPKRDNYELILRRCNFTDVSDPLFPVMLFLLFLQDNLTDTSEEVAREVKTLRKEMVPHLPEQPKRQAVWKIACILLILLQIILSFSCLWRISAIHLPDQNPVSGGTAPECGEIRKMNDYWEFKLKQERQKMNWNEWMNDDITRIVFPAAIFFMILILSHIFLMIFMLARMLREDEKIFRRIDRVKHDFHALCNEGNKSPQEEIRFCCSSKEDPPYVAGTNLRGNADSPNFPVPKAEEESSAPKE